MAEICDNRMKFIEKGSFVKKGTTLIEAEPFVSVLSSKFRAELCDTCLKRSKLSRCSGCQWVYYCSRSCQKKSWALHKIECPNIKRVYPMEVPDAARMMARIIIKLQNGGDEERGYYSSNDYRTFGDLMSHYSDIKVDLKKIDHFTSLCAVLADFLPNSMLPSVRECCEIYGRMSTNSFHILDSEITSIGVGIYLGPSIIDHSCNPNASTVFDGTTLTVRAFRDIPSFDWSKVSITYIDILQSVDERRTELQNSYYFWCDCERCSNPEPVAGAAACPNKNCTNPCFPEDKRCGKCGQQFPANFHDDFEMIVSRSLHYLEKMENNPSNLVLEDCRMCLKEQEGLLHSLNMLHVRMLEIALPSATELELWDEAGIYARKLTQKYEYYYGDTHPLTVRVYILLAKLLGFGRKPKEGYDVIRKVSDVAKVAFGENHSKIKEVSTLEYCIRLECMTINENR